jgi:hypothetical protein
MSGTLAHNSSHLVSRDQLKSISVPPATATWKPVPHYDLVHAIDRQLAVRDMRIVAEQFAIQREGLRLFGVLDLEIPGTNVAEHYRFAMGVRTANDRSEALSIVVGARVFVCDNLALSGDVIAIRRKHTAGFDLNADISRAIDRYQSYLQIFHRQLGELMYRPLADEQAKLIIYEIFAAEILPVRFFATVAETYFRPTPTMTDVQPRTYWALHNAFTRAIRQMAPGPAFLASSQLGRSFGLTTSSLAAEAQS